SLQKAWGWGNIEKKIKERTGKSFDKKQLKNKWDTMKKEVKLYDRLMRIESGIGWDPVRKTIVASPEWWDEKIKGDKDLAKFRDLNLEIYQVYYEPLFRDSVAIEDKTKAPVECQNNSGPTNVEDKEDHEGKENSDEVNLGDDDKHLFPQSSSSKRKKPNNVAPTRSTKGKSSVTSSFEDTLDN
ncbi:Myb/SANT-like domain-containing protein, partial [Cynara cardunculus var. scolymus]